MRGAKVALKFPSWLLRDYDPIIRELLPQYFVQPSFPPSADSHPTELSHLPIPPTYLPHAVLLELKWF